MTITKLAGRTDFQVAAAVKWLAPIERGATTVALPGQPGEIITTIDRLLATETTLQGKSGQRVALQSLRRALEAKLLAAADDELAGPGGDDGSGADFEPPTDEAVAAAVDEALAAEATKAPVVKPKRGAKLPEAKVAALRADIAGAGSIGDLTAALSNAVDAVEGAEAPKRNAKGARIARSVAARHLKSVPTAAPVLDVDPQWTTLGRVDVGDLVWSPGTASGRNESRETVIPNLRKVTRIEGARHFPTLKLVGRKEVQGGRATKLWVVKAAVAAQALPAAKKAAKAPAKRAAKNATAPERTGRTRNTDLYFVMADHPDTYTCRQCEVEQKVSVFPTVPAGIGVPRTERQSVCRSCRAINNGHAVETVPAPKSKPRASEAVAAVEADEAKATKRAPAKRKASAKR